MCVMTFGAQDLTNAIIMCTAAAVVNGRSTCDQYFHQETSVYHCTTTNEYSIRGILHYIIGDV